MCVCECVRVCTITAQLVSNRATSACEESVCVCVCVCVCMCVCVYVCVCVSQSFRLSPVASYQGLPLQLFRSHHGWSTAAEKSCEGRPWYEVRIPVHV